jgi:hypothetical protein
MNEIEAYEYFPVFDLDRSENDKIQICHPIDEMAKTSQDILSF